MSYYLFDGVQQISASEAYDFYESNHYLGRPSALNWFHSGLIENHRLVGAVSFGYPAAPPVIDACFNDHDDYKIRELVRLAANSNKTPLSSFVMSSVKSYCKIKKVDALISYADTGYHHGGIYQACSWLYLGETKPTQRFIDQNGRHQHRRNNGKNISSVEALKRGLTSCTTTKYRYLYLYRRNKRALMRRLKYDVLQYPKVKNADQDPRTFHSST